MSNGSEHIPERPFMGVFSFSTLDEKMYKYDSFTEPELQNIVEQFPTEIFFVLTGEEVEVVDEENDLLINVEGGVCSGLKGQHHPLCIVGDETHDSHLVDVTNNLKKDFIYYHATINGTSWWECTCGNFLETDAKGEDRMLKRTVAHARKSGHTINPRGN